MLRYRVNTTTEHNRRRLAGTGTARYNALVERFPIGSWALANYRNRALVGRVTGHTMDAWQRPMVLVNGLPFLFGEVRRLCEGQVRFLGEVLEPGAEHWEAQGWLDGLTGNDE